jgi:hypothetical protein
MTHSLAFKIQLFQKSTSLLQFEKNSILFFQITIFLKTQFLNGSFTMILFKIVLFIYEIAISNALLNRG